MGEEAQDFWTAERFLEAFTAPMTADSDLGATMFYAVNGGLHIAVFADTPPPEQGGIQTMLRRVLPQLKENPGPADWIWFGSEAYGRTYKKDEEVKRHQPGELQRAVEAGVDEDIFEMVVLCGVGPDKVVMAQKRFERKDGEVVWIGDLMVHEVGPAEDVGAIADILRTAVK